MYDVLAVVGVWSISLIVAFLSVRQAKGIDWYAPISSKWKMTMTLINISIGLGGMMLVFLVVPGRLWKVIVTSVICIIISCFFIFQYILSSRKPEYTDMDRTAQNESIESVQNGIEEDSNEKNTLLDVFSKILTVFNVTFLFTNIIYVLGAYEFLDRKSVV